MSEVFLSASIPIEDRGRYYETGDPFLIQIAVRELLAATIRDHSVVWGGHPAITPMVWAVCEDLGVEYSKSVVLYQSEYFIESFPNENENFPTVVLVPKVEDDREASLSAMRTAMLSRPTLRAAVFIGGMEGVEVEYQLFRQYHPNAPVFAIGSTGGAARDLAFRLESHLNEWRESVDYSGLFLSKLLPLLR